MPSVTVLGKNPAGASLSVNVYGGWGRSVLYVPGPLGSQCVCSVELRHSKCGLDPDCLQKKEEKWSEERGSETQRQIF